ncbi:MAG TPA: ribbon-helix-helix domain-containing protein [Bryobacteraceae bacterium]|nr:ribbon-helix-helix domain-containing protein [Bryobacteraceae bacterium]
MELAIFLELVNSVSVTNAPAVGVYDFAMENAATSVRIPGDAVDILSGLAAKLGQSKAQVIERALKELEASIFWEETRQAFERIADDPTESARQQPEMALWDRGTASDFKAEEW